MVKLWDVSYTILVTKIYSVIKLLTRNVTLKLTTALSILLMLSLILNVYLLFNDRVVDSNVNRDQQSTVNKSGIFPSISPIIKPSDGVCGGGGSGKENTGGGRC